MKKGEATNSKCIKSSKKFKKRKKQREFSNRVLCNLLDADVVVHPSDITEVRSIDGTDSAAGSSVSTLSSEADLQSLEDNGLCPNEKLKVHSIFKAKPALALDCEMVGVGERRENALARCSIVNYDGNVIYDAYVKPERPITDYRTRWSGIRPSDLSQAVPFFAARKQVKRLIKKHILVGHSIQVDLRVLNLHHTNFLIRDTAKYVPLRTLAKLPANTTPSLKRLTSNLLNKDIQQAEHCSVEDARATMSLYKLCESQWENSVKPGDGHNFDHYLGDAFWPEWTTRTKK